MDVWLLILVSLSLCLVVNLYLLSSLSSRRRSPLPPGPAAVPFIGNLLWFRNRFSLRDLEPVLRSLRSIYGPIIRLRIGSRNSIFIADRAIAHATLVQSGAVFADRPVAVRFLGGNQRNVSGSQYGPIWRLLRRNLSAEILHPSRIKHFSDARRWVLEILLGELRRDADKNDGAVVVIENFQFAMFCLLVLMCFGEKLDEKDIREIEVAQREFLLFINKLNVFAILPSITRYIFRDRLRKAIAFRERQRSLFVPLIRARRDQKLKKVSSNGEERFVYSYVDSLLDIKLPEEEDGGRNLNEDEIVSLCSEFLNAGTDTTSTSLQWIMANLVRNQDIQTKLAQEIEEVVGKDREGEVKEEELQHMSYLKAVIMEGLRRHPPGHFVLPHAVTEEVQLGNYVIPKNTSVNFMVTEMNWDENVWTDPLEFRPERFLPGGEGEAVDITGSREIKIMTFGAGRRICPGLGLAMLHLEYFVANLVKEFKWMTVVDGEEVDLTEKPVFTVVMEKPLRAKIVPRTNRAAAAAN